MGKSSWSRSCASVNTAPCCSCRHRNARQAKRRRLSERQLAPWLDLGRLVTIHNCLKRHQLVALLEMLVDRDLSEKIYRLTARVNRMRGGQHWLFN